MRLRTPQVCGDSGHDAAHLKQPPSERASGAAPHRDEVSRRAGAHHYGRVLRARGVLGRVGVRMARMPQPPPPFMVVLGNACALSEI